MNYNQNTFTGPSFSLKNRFLRFFWNNIYIILFKYSPRQFFLWRSLLLKCFGAKIGVGVHIYPKVKIWAPWNIEIGNNVGISDGAVLYSQDKIKIGDRTVISENTYICTGTHDYRDKGFKLYTRPIIIAEDCWLSYGVFVHPGIIISQGVIIGACSVVIKNLSECSVYSGNPCKKIKNRYDNNKN